MKTDVLLMSGLTALSLMVSAVAHAAMTGGVMDLSTPAALQVLRDQRPDHYAKARAILALAESRPGADRWIEARFGASDVQMLQWRVSDPPRLRVSFALDDARYTAEVVPRLPPARAVPAR